ncbi:GlsB/YeaQ/YmgE family stress response membrane protein [Hydrogenophaga sp.]|uniref:GlsB/YeaQ/YmgE family stress response membrane protein n=1 Tax=Hydrogenophaga sp. TaxID=1904254 RepID=UPI003F6E6F77
MINFLLWLVAGGVLGWVASVVMLNDSPQGTFMNLIVGVCGAALGGWFLSPMVGLGTVSETAFSMGGLLVAMVGAIVLLSVYNVFRPGPAR